MDEGDAGQRKLFCDRRDRCAASWRLLCGGADLGREQRHEVQRLRSRHDHYPRRPDPLHRVRHQPDRNGRRRRRRTLHHRRRQPPPRADPSGSCQKIHRGPRTGLHLLGNDGRQLHRGREGRQREGNHQRDPHGLRRQNLQGRRHAPDRHPRRESPRAEHGGGQGHGLHRRLHRRPADHHAQGQPRGRREHRHHHHPHTGGLRQDRAPTGRRRDP